MGLLLRQENEYWVVEVREKWKIPIADWEGVRDKLLVLQPNPSGNTVDGIVHLSFSMSKAMGNFKVILSLFNELAVLKEKYGNIGEVTHGKNNK